MEMLDISKKINSLNNLNIKYNNLKNKIIILEKLISKLNTIDNITLTTVMYSVEVEISDINRKHYKLLLKKQLIEENKNLVLLESEIANLISIINESSKL